MSSRWDIKGAIETFEDTYDLKRESSVTNTQGYAFPQRDATEEIQALVRPDSEDEFDILEGGREDESVLVALIDQTHSVDENDLLKVEGEWWRLTEQQVDYFHGYDAFVLVED